MSATEKSTPVESIPEIRLDFSEFHDPEAQTLRDRLIPYGFGTLFIVAAVAALVLLLTNPAEYVTEESETPAEVERLVAGAKERMNLAGGYPPQLDRDAVLTISTNPAGALVDVDHQNVGLTPLEYSLRPGVYMISVRSPDYAAVDTVLVVEPNASQEVSFQLTPLRSGGRLGPNVAGPASGGTVGAANARRQEAGPSNPSRASAGVQSPSLGSAATNSARTASADLVISSHPAGADVLLDGRRMGTTPLSLRSVSPGSHQIKLVMATYEPYEVEVDARVGETETVHGELTRQIGTLAVLVKPWGSIYIDGVLHMQSTDVKYITRLPAGKYTVRAVHPELGAAERTVEIAANGTREIVFDLP